MRSQDSTPTASLIATILRPFFKSHLEWVAAEREPWSHGLSPDSGAQVKIPSRKNRMSDLLKATCKMLRREATLSQLPTQISNLRREQRMSQGSKEQLTSATTARLRWSNTARSAGSCAPLFESNEVPTNSHQYHFPL